MSRSVVITGAGHVGCFGCGWDGLSGALRDSKCRLSPVGNLRRERRRSARAVAALVGEADLSPWLSPAKARRMSLPSRFAAAASQMATQEDPGHSAAGAVSVVLGTSFGTARFAESLMEEIFLQGPQAASPFYFSESVANAPAAQVAILLGAPGANLAITQREASGVLAIVAAATEIDRGRSPAVLAGAVDEINPFVHDVLDRLRAVARPGRGGEPPVARPFDRRRDGFLVAEGATVFALADSEAAARRGAATQARVIAWGRAFDPTAAASSWGRGAAALAEEIRRSLQRHDLELDEIDRVVSGASGSRAGDRLEAAILRQLWSMDDCPPILAPKAVTGEYGGGFLGAAFLAATGREFGPTAGFTEMDPELGLVPYDGRPLPPPQRVLVLSFAAGGAAAWTVLAPPDSRATDATPLLAIASPGLS